MTDFASLLDSLAEGRVTELPLALIDADPQQPRRTFAKAALNDLAADIAAHGVLQPISVCADIERERFVVELGERRVRACALAGRASVPALFAADAHAAAPGADTLARRLRQLAENAQREALNPMDFAAFLRGLRDDLGLTPTQIAATLKTHGYRELSRAHVANTIRLTELPARFQAQIRAGELPPGHGKYLAQLPDVPGAIEAFDEALADRCTPADGERFTPTRGDVQDAIGDALDAVGFRLDGFAFGLRDALPERLQGEQFAADGTYLRTSEAQFDTAACARCEHRRQLTIDGATRVYCVDRAAFLEKQVAAIDALVAAPAAAGEAGDDAPAAVSPAQREAKLRAKVHAHLTDWLRAQVRAWVLAWEHPPVQFLAWLAAGAGVAEEYDPGVPICRPRAFDAAALAALHLGDPLLVPASQVDLDWRGFGERAVAGLDDVQVWRWSIALGFGLDGYRLDDGYLDCCDRAELVQLARALEIAEPANFASYSKSSIAELIKRTAPDAYLPDRVEAVFEDTVAEHERIVAAHRAALADEVAA